MRTGTIILVYAMLLVGCVDDAPHDNPLDPNYKRTGSLSGRVIIENHTSGIPGAIIFDMRDSIFALTDSSGHFSFSTLSEGLHSLSCTKINFDSDTFSVQISAGETASIVRELNGAPIVSYQKILTRKIDQFFPSAQYFVEVIAVVTDPNDFKDVDSVWFTVDTTISINMIYNPQYFSATILQKKFPTNTLQWLINRPLTIISKDTRGTTSKSVPFYVSRIIDDEAEPISPISDSTVSIDSLSLHWSVPNVTFNYTFTLTITSSSPPNGTITITGLNAVDEPRKVTLPEKGKYIWSVSIVDDFGNYSRSKEASFVVK